MKAQERRQLILQLLEQQSGPVSASALAKELRVSRQVIVGDVALLRAENHAITATHRGYVLSSRLFQTPTRYLGKVVCRHGQAEVREELELIIDNGGEVLDVEVEHPVYGMLTAPLTIASREDIDAFMERLEAHQGVLLSTLTEGIHLHTLACQSREVFDRLREQLRAAGFLLEDS